MKVGFIGLGRMGQAMAARVQGGGHELVVYNRTRAKCADLEKAGAKVAGSMVEACRGRDVVISMVTDDKALAEVVNEGVVPGLPKGSHPRRDGHAQRRGPARDRPAARQGGPDPDRGARARPSRGRGRRPGRHRRGRAEGRDREARAACCR